MALISLDRESSTRRAEAAPVEYESYLTTKSWRTTRDRARRLANYRCQRCGTTRDLEVHHKTYKRLGAELDSDLEVLCRGCHNSHHLEEAQQKPGQSVYVRLVSEAVEATPMASVADLSDDVKRLCIKHGIHIDVPAIDRAISLVCSTRLKSPTRIQQPLAPTQAETPLTHTQAVEFLARIRAKLQMPGAVAKPMPTGPLVRQGQADQLKAFAMVTVEIAAASERCDALEAALVERAS